MYYIRKILIIFIFTVAIFLNCPKADALVKINNVNFDNSNNFMFLSTTNQTGEHNIESMSLDHPNRIFFDIKDAILTRQNETWYFRNSDIHTVKVSQFSTSPNIVRVVFYHNDNFNPKDIKVINVKGNFLFKYNNFKLQQNSFLQTYRETEVENTDYLEKVVYIPESEVTEQNLLSDVNSNIELQKQVQNTVKTIQNFNWQKVFKLRTNFFLSRVEVKRGNILLMGSGHITVQKPILLTNPTRIVYDLPNTRVDDKFKNVEIKLSENETVKIGQFEPYKVRIVITTPTPTDYQPIFSHDQQGVLLSNINRMAGIKLFEKGAQLQSYKVGNQNSKTDYLLIRHSAPIIHSVERKNNTIEVIIYNETGFDSELLKKSIEDTKLSTIKGEKLNIGGVKYTINLSDKANLETYLCVNGKDLLIRIKNNKKEKNTDEYKATNLIVIDPGHGGADAGAIRDGLNEKDINLDVSKMVVKLLEQKGYKVDMTRWDDSTLSLQERVDFSDEKRAAIFVSIHTNSSVREEPEGIETHWWTDEGQELAQVVHPVFANKVKAFDRGLVKSKFYVINHTKARSILIEIGFISNEKERKILATQEYKSKIAEGIASGIIKFMRSEAKK